MSMAHSACFDEVIEDKNIKKILGKEHSRKLTSFIKLFGKVAEEEGASCVIEYIVEHTTSAVSDPETKDIQKLDALWTDIHKLVKKKTGLDLEVCYHDVDSDGDCYDEVNGLYFAFSHSQLYKPTKAYANLMKLYGEEVVERKFYTIFC